MWGKKILLRLLVICIPCAGALLSFVYSSPMSGREIVKEAFYRNDGEDAYFKVEMVLIDKHNRQRRRILEVYTKDYGDLMKSYIRFIEPPDIEGTAFLSWENKEGDDTQYLYLPALGRARRIVSSQKSLRFVNTDFTYEDMQRRRPEKDDHKLLREEVWNNRMCYVVESIPRGNSSQYLKRVVWIDKERFMVLRVEFYNQKGERFKEMRVEEVKSCQGIWTAMVTVMEDFKRRHKTVMRVLDVKYNQGLSDEIFSLRNLEEN